MAKLKDIGPCFDRYDFEEQRARKRNKDLRFEITAIHQKNGIRVIIKAPKNNQRKIKDRKKDRKKVFRGRHLIITLVDGACRPLVGVAPILVKSIANLEKILHAVATGEYKDRLAA